MIINVSDDQFKNIMTNPNLSLPIRWNGREFEESIHDLLDEYINELDSFFIKEEDDIRRICNLLEQCIREYHQGFPATAFRTISKVMKQLMQTPLKVYQKSGALEPFDTDRLYLFRLRRIDGAAKHTRKDIFHVPSYARSMVSTCRYSIAGYPSLYLTTSISLGLEEINSTDSNVLVSRFKIIRPQRELNIRVLELGIKPQDFYWHDSNNTNLPSRDFNDIDLRNREVRARYLSWYPLIAACSFIRANKNAPFSSEYIVPQLLMQWVRIQIGRDQLMGIRYFSCASVRASDLGFDYVFPVNNTKYEGSYCSVLRDSFLLSNPVYLKDYNSAHQCERYLIDCNDLDKM